jgi:heat-inducible transcriptional repressor
MADLEKKGYIKKPHTSAGRIPSDKGYRFFIDNILEETSLSQREAETVREKLLNAMKDDLFDMACNALSQMSGNASLVISADRNKIMYINGIYRLLRQPEFGRADRTSEVVELIEKHNDMIDLLNEYTDEEDDLSIRVGGENSVRQLKQCSVASAKYKDKGIISVIGPTRMDYKRVSSVLRYFADLLEEM